MDEDGDGRWRVSNLEAQLPHHSRDVTFPPVQCEPDAKDDLGEEKNKDKIPGNRKKNLRTT